MVFVWALCACVLGGEGGKVGDLRSANAESKRPVDEAATAAADPATIEATHVSTISTPRTSAAPAPDATSAAVASAAPELVADAGAGLDAGAPLEPACPEGMAQINRFCVDRYEAHLVSAAENGEIRPVSHVLRPQAGVRYEARSAPGVFPQAYISRVEAAAACKNAGKRLCTMREWRRACQGSRWTTYPYGHRREAGRCNSGKAHLLQAHFGSNASLWKYDEHFNSPKLNEEPGFLAKSGAHDGCASDAQVYDMVGNLHEWVSDKVTEELVSKMDDENITRHKQPWREGNAVFLGGFFSTTGELGPGCKYITIAHEPAYHDYSTGFRCCAAAKGPAPEPASAKPAKTKPRKPD